MKAAALRDHALGELIEFAWDQWSAIGVSGAVGAPDERRAIDPEALILFTLEIARSDPRLFDEVLDWLVTNESLISVQRLRNLAGGDQDRRLADAALTWVDQFRPRTRLRSAPSPARDTERLFFGTRAPRGEPDPAFAAHGFTRSPAKPSGKSQEPDYATPVSLAFRLRRHFGLGVRAEVVRVLLTIDAPRVRGRVLTTAAGFADRNVRDALAQLADAGTVQVVIVGGERHYAIDKAAWEGLLHVDEDRRARHYDWVQALRAATAIVRWLRRRDLDGLSDYLLASEARTLLDTVTPDLHYAGIPLIAPHGRGLGHWNAFDRAVRMAVTQIRHGG